MRAQHEAFDYICIREPSLGDKTNLGAGRGIVTLDKWLVVRLKMNPFLEQCER